MPTRACKLIGAGLACAFLTALPIAWAHDQGAGKGHTGSPDSYARFPLGGICTECHVFRPGGGSVELLGAPQRYRGGVSYDLTVRIADPDAGPDPKNPRQGAGFEVSAEGPGGHQGALVLTDTTNTKFANNDPDDVYVTHTIDGYLDSLDQWDINGRSYEYRFSWIAPPGDAGPVTLFVAGNAGNNDGGLDNDHFYATHVTMPFGVEGDADSDGDFDLFDFAMLQECFNGTGPVAGAGCGFADFDPVDGKVDDQDAQAFLALSLTGPAPSRMSRTSGLPPGYVVADKVRGGLLYDKWWVVNGAAAPSDPTQVGNSHPLYPTSDVVQSGPTTFRCKECHGWDYKGSDGAYGTNPDHFTGIAGINQTMLRPEQLFALLKGNPVDVPNGHDMDQYGMSDADIWDVVKMTLEGVVDTDVYIIPAPAPFFVGLDLTAGEGFYDAYCAACHDNRTASAPRGTWLNFGTEADPIYLDNLTRSNPYEVLHTMRFGHPGAPMPSLELLGFNDPADLKNLGSFCAAECRLGTGICDDVNATCTDHPTGFTCDCNPGWVSDGVICIPAP